MRNIFNLFLIVAACLIIGCKQNSKTDLISNDKQLINYSTLLKCYKCDGYTKFVVVNPADTLKIARVYILVDKKNTFDSLPEGTIIKTPISNALVCTSVHAGLLRTLGAKNQIGGVCDSKYIIDSIISQMVDKQQIVDCGFTSSPDKEKIITLNPDVVLISPYDGMQSSNFFESSNIPIVDCVDYLETSPLAQAEWIKFYGAITGHEKEADSIFTLVEHNYTSLRDSIAKVETRPKLLAEKMYQQTWFVATSNSTSAQFYNDAGADYVFKNENASGRVSIAKTFEQVYAKAYNADIWLFKYYGENFFYTLSKLKEDYSLYSEFKAFKTNKIYACNTWKYPFYDVVPFRPDIYLKELAYIIHPELFTNYQPTFFTPLQP